jgi:hypothetical protein
MFSAIRSAVQWLLRKVGVLPSPGIDLYRPKERKLYGYWNGYKTIWEDPMVLWKRFMDVGPELSADIRASNFVLNNNYKASIEASDNIIDKIRSIFDVKPYDKENPCQSGLTEIQLTDLLGHFMMYCDYIKKNGQENPPPMPTGEPTPSPSNLPTEGNPAMKLDSVSTSTEELPSIDKPTLSPSVSESPSDSSNQDLIILGPTQTERAKP